MEEMEKTRLVLVTDPNWGLVKWEEPPPAVLGYPLLGLVWGAVKLQLVGKDKV